MSSFNASCAQPKSGYTPYVPLCSTPQPPFNPTAGWDYTYAGSPPTMLRKSPQQPLARPVTRNTVWQMTARQPGFDIPYTLRTWFGNDSPGVPHVFAPHLRTNEHLKSYGWPANFFRLYLRRADGTPQKMIALRTAIKGSTKFQQMTGNMAIPSVFVPTSLANQYRGRANI